MTKDELRNLRVGDKVRWVGKGTDTDTVTDGWVFEKFMGRSHIMWKDSISEWIGWRASDDRQRAKNIELVKSENPPS